MFIPTNDLVTTSWKSGGNYDLCQHWHFGVSATAQLETLKQRQSLRLMKPGFKVRVRHFVYLSVVLITSVITRLPISLEFVIYVRWWWFKLYVHIFYWRFRFKMVAVASGLCGRARASLSFSRREPLHCSQNSRT